MNKAATARNILRRALLAVAAISDNKAGLMPALRGRLHSSESASLTEGAVAPGAGDAGLSISLPQRWQAVAWRSLLAWH